MATNPQLDPIEEEALRILEANPELKARLKEFHRRLNAGEQLDLHEHEEARRIVGLEQQGSSIKSAD